MNLILLAVAALTVTAPDGSRVCSVLSPAEESGVVLETTNLVGGVAWRLRYDGEGERTITDERWTFDFGADLKCWPVHHAQGEYIPKTVSTIGEVKPMPDTRRSEWEGRGRNYSTIIPGTAEAPLTVEGPTWTAVLGDAGNLDYARTRYRSGAKAGTIETLLEGAVTVKLPYVTPWRYLHVAESPAALASTQDAFMKALSRPSEIADTSWIKPGKVLRVSKLTTESSRACVDFAVRNSFPYIELDSGWYGDERRDDPLKPGLAPEKLARGEELDVPGVIAYANAKGIGVILYVNREPLKTHSEAILDQIKAWGAAGVKLGFVNVGEAKWRALTVEWIRQCAARKLLVDVHDEFRPSGIQNTFPNLLTAEGIHGNEEMPNAAHNCALVFTRFLDGPGDYTPCWKCGRVKNTLAHQLAMPCVYTSGLQFLFWYQRAEEIDEKNPALDFWREIPTAFDETRFLDGRIGEFAVVARRAGSKWFLGCLNAGERRTFTVPLDFLGRAGAPRAPLTLRLFRDADPSNASPRAPIACETRTVTSEDVLNVDAAANGGWCAIVE